MDTRAAVQDLALRLRRRLVAGPYQSALETMNLLRKIIGIRRWSTVEDLLAEVKSVGRQLVLAQPYEMAIGSMVGRVLYFIRDAHQAHLEELGHERRASSAEAAPAAEKTVEDRFAHMLLRQASLKDMVMSGSERNPSGRATIDPALKSAIMESLTLYRDELLTMHEEIEKQALEYIHTDSVILTLGASESVRIFLKGAARKGLNFHVVVLEGDPQPQRGHTLAKDLAKAGITCTIVPDAALFTIISRVSQVVISTRAVMANGGLQATAGTHTVALAAKQFGIPVVCVTGCYKVCPVYPHDMDSFVELGSPAVVRAGIEGADGSRDQTKNVQVCNPLTDYVPPELVTLYVTEQGGHQPSYIYRLLSDFYNHKDLGWYQQ